MDEENVVSGVALLEERISLAQLNWLELMDDGGSELNISVLKEPNFYKNLSMRFINNLISQIDGQLSQQLL